MTPAQADIIKQHYREVYDRVYAALADIGEIVLEDFPHPDAAAGPSRGDIDMLRALGNQLLALVEVYEHNKA